MIELSQAELKSLLEYDPDTGIFKWLVDRNQHVLAGSVAGHKHHSGYIQIKIGSKLYQAHRLAWLYMHGLFPPRYIDHRNFDKADNRITNLRLASTSQSSSYRRAYGNKPSKGVQELPSGRYQWRICLNGSYTTGTEDILEQAIESRNEAAKTAHGEFYHD